LRKEREIEIYSDIDFIEDGGSGIVITEMMQCLMRIDAMTFIFDDIYFYKIVVNLIILMLYICDWTPL